jgi:hypothetical protein
MPSKPILAMKDAHDISHVDDIPHESPAPIEISRILRKSGRRALPSLGPRMCALQLGSAGWLLGMGRPEKIPMGR